MRHAIGVALGIAGFALDAAAGNPWQLWIDGELRCPIGALGFAVQNPDTLDIVPVYDAMVPQRELYRLCPWTEED